jgi:hypothetical protein
LRSPLRQSLNPRSKPIADGSSCGALPSMPCANGGVLTGLDFARAVSIPRAFSSSRRGRRRTQLGRLKKA